MNFISSFIDFSEISSFSFDIEFALPRARLLNAFLTSEKKTSFNF